MTRRSIFERLCRLRTAGVVKLLNAFEHVSRDARRFRWERHHRIFSARFERKVTTQIRTDSTRLLIFWFSFQNGRYEKESVTRRRAPPPPAAVSSHNSDSTCLLRPLVKQHHATTTTPTRINNTNEIWKKKKKSIYSSTENQSHTTRKSTRKRSRRFPF